jgi:signal transduction histidine kinase
MGFTDLLYSDYADLTDEERLSFILEMKKSAELSFNLLQNILLWSRSQTGKIEFKPAKLELINLVSNNLLLIANSAEQKRIRLINNVLPDIYIKADEEMINTVLRNLLTNAVKFSNLEGSITTNAAVYEKFVEISITDCGVGMNPKTVENLFRLDVAHSTIGTQNETGTGLGLILCKEFIEKNGGSINVESEIGKGTKFTFTLPA